MRFSILSVLALAPAAFAFGYESDNHAIIARDISALKGSIATLERRLDSLSYNDEASLAARSFDEEEYLDMLIARAFTDTPNGAHSHGTMDMVTPQNIQRINTALGNHRNGRGRTTEDKRQAWSDRADRQDANAARRQARHG